MRSRAGSKNRREPGREAPTCWSAVVRAAGHGRRALRLAVRVHPAAVTRTIESAGCFRIDISWAHKTAKSRLDMAGRAAEPIVKVEVAKSRIEIIAPEQAHDPPTQPQTFRVGRRSAQKPLGLREF